MVLSADDVRSLHRSERKILLALERLMKRYQWVPLDLLKRDLGLSLSEVTYRLGRLMERGMVRYDTVPYEGYALVSTGYDAMALATLTRRGTISALGCQIGEGKESVVYEALGLTRVALKFHHVGQRSFQQVRVAREYLPEQGHCPWIFASRYSAEREYEALIRLHPGVSVPLPVDSNRHVVVMEYIDGVNLNRCELEDPEPVLEEILDAVARMYKSGIIHADLSEFNVMLRDGKPVLIDWPQWVDTSHPNANEILTRDVGNIIRYFSRKYQIRKPEEEVVAWVTG